MLFISSESVSPAVPNCKGDRIQPFLLCGTELQFITFGLKGSLSVTLVGERVPYLQT